MDSDNSTTSSIKNFGKNNKKIKTNDGKQTKFIEMNHNNLNINNYNLEFDIDPLLEKNSAIFDEGSSLGLLIINLFV